MRMSQSVVDILAELLCGGCDKCVTKSELWSDFNKVHDVIPLTIIQINAPLAEVQLLRLLVAKDKHDEATKAASFVTVLMLVTTVLTLLLGGVRNLGEHNLALVQ